MSGAPTGCYKCGRVGHWSRDCTFDPKQQQAPAAAATGAAAAPPPLAGRTGAGAGAAVAPPPKSSVFREPRRRKRKLTPELLLSKEGLGYVLEHLTHRYRIKGRGHEEEDLRNLLRGYRHWQSNFFPTLSFRRFLHEVSALGRVRRVKARLREVRSRAAEVVDLKDCLSNLDTSSAEMHNQQQQQHGSTSQDQHQHHQQENVPKFNAVSRDDPGYAQKMDRMEANRLRALELARARQARQAATAGID